MPYGRLAGTQSRASLSWAASPGAIEGIEIDVDYRDERKGSTTDTMVSNRAAGLETPYFGCEDSLTSSADKSLLMLD